MSVRKRSLATLKIVIIGESGVGKSSLLLQLTEDNFMAEQTPTIGICFKTKELSLKGDYVKLAIWDTAGQERFRNITPMFYRDARGAILVYDVTDRNTFTKLEAWLDELYYAAASTNLTVITVGNKTDVECNRQVSTEEGMKFAKKHNTLFMETSARTRIGVDETFEELADKIIDKLQVRKSRVNAVSEVDSFILVENTQQKVKKKCSSPCQIF